MKQTTENNDLTPQQKIDGLIKLLPEYAADGSKDLGELLAGISRIKHLHAEQKPSEKLSYDSVAVNQIDTDKNTVQRITTALTGMKPRGGITEKILSQKSGASDRGTAL